MHLSHSWLGLLSALLVVYDYKWSVEVIAKVRLEQYSGTGSYMRNATFQRGTRFNTALDD